MCLVSGALHNSKNRRGHSVVEVGLIAPWIFLLFVGILDFGFYAYAIIATQNAARSAALAASAGHGSLGDATIACPYALAELRLMPNVTASTTCTCASKASCTAGPIIVTATAVNGVDSIAGQPPVEATEVSVRYNGINLIPIPGLMGQLSLTRIVQVRLKES